MRPRLQSSSWLVGSIRIPNFGLFDIDDAVLLFTINANEIVMGVCKSGSGVGSLICDGIMIGVATVFVVAFPVCELDDDTTSTTG